MEKKDKVGLSSLGYFLICTTPLQALVPRNEGGAECSGGKVGRCPESCGVGRVRACARVRRHVRAWARWSWKREAPLEDER